MYYKYLKSGLFLNSPSNCLILGILHPLLARSRITSPVFVCCTLCIKHQEKSLKIEAKKPRAGPGIEKNYQLQLWCSQSLNSFSGFLTSLITTFLHQEPSSINSVKKLSVGRSGFYKQGPPLSLGAPPQDWGNLSLNIQAQFLGFTWIGFFIVVKNHNKKKERKYNRFSSTCPLQCWTHAQDKSIQLQMSTQL